MNCFKTMYLHLFNRVTDALLLLGNGQSAAAERLLQAAQLACEEIYISAETDEDGNNKP